MRKMKKYFCLEMKKLICSGKLQEAIQIICNFMSKHPNSAIPHNLLGIIYEKKTQSYSSNETF